MGRADRRSRRVKELIAEFPSLVDSYDRAAPFNKVGQLDLHRQTIAIRRRHESVAGALTDTGFIESLHTTLHAWGIGSRASVLVPIDRFGTALREWTDVFVELDHVTIDDPGLDIDRTTNLLWQLTSGIDIVENKAKLVALSKTIHHVLPDLLPPIDRAYTQKFFLWHPIEFQDQQELVFRSIFHDFVTIARRVDPARYVGSGWRTSRTKVIDNAIVAFVKDSSGTQQRYKRRDLQPPDPTLLMSSYTVQDLYDKIEEFRRELEAADLRPNTVDTYAGRSKTFVDWLAGRYVPRGPNADAE